MTGKELCSLMRKHKVTIKELAKRTQITMKRIREARKEGLKAENVIRDWKEAITGEKCASCKEREIVNHYDKVMGDIRGLANGTLATLCGEANYDKLDDVRLAFTDWVQRQCDFAPCVWETWQEAWAAFVAACPQYRKRETVKIYTSAPKDYDGFGTTTLEENAGVDGGKMVRLVAAEVEHEEWQRSRYFSGCHSAYSPDVWQDLVARGLTQVEQAETLGEPAALEAKEEEQPVVQEPEGSVVLLPANLGCLAKIAATASPRYAITGVMVKRQGHGYRVEATDGRRLAIVSASEADLAADFPPVPGLADAPNGEKSAIIPAGVFEKAFRAAPKGRLAGMKPVLGNVATVLGKDVTTLASTDLENINFQQPRNVEGRWPETDQVFPKRKPKAKFNIDAKLLAELLKVATEFSAEQQGRVELHFWSESQPVELVTKNEKGQQFRGAIMPIS